MTDLQQLARDLNKALEDNAPGLGNGLDQKALCIAEEAGEVVGAYRRWSGQARRTGTKAELEDEVADLLICTASFAEKAGIDIGKAIQSKLEKVYSRGWTEKMTGHVHNQWTCPPHVGGCDCPDPGNSLCNPYYRAGSCPDEQ